MGVRQFWAPRIFALQTNSSILFFFGEGEGSSVTHSIRHVHTVHLLMPIHTVGYNWIFQHLISVLQNLALDRCRIQLNMYRGILFWNTKKTTLKQATPSLQLVYEFKTNLKIVQIRLAGLWQMSAFWRISSVERRERKRPRLKVRTSRHDANTSPTQFHRIYFLFTAYTDCKRWARMQVSK